MESVAAVLRELSLPPAEIATRTRLSISRVEELVAGAQPSISDLRALSRGLRLPLKAFAIGSASPTESRELRLKFRSLPRQVAEKHEPTYESVASFVDAALRVLPQREALPKWAINFHPTEESSASASALAQSFRRALYPQREDEPAPDLPQRLDQLDGTIVSQLPHSKYEGASLTAGGYIFIFISPRFPGRMLFTAAHELGHVLAHHSMDVPKFETTTDIGKGRAKSERFVDAFASEFLLPTRGLARALTVIRRALNTTADYVGDVEISYLSRIYGVSFYVAAKRCEDLDLLPTGGAASIAESIKRNFGSAERRAESLSLPPRPPVTIPTISGKILKAAFTQIASEEISASWLADQLGISIQTLQALHSNMSNRDAHNN